MTRQKKIMFGGGGAFLGVAITALIVAMSGESGPRRSRAAGAAGPSPKVQLPSLLCVVRVNEARGMRLDRGSPLYVQCIFSNPLKDRSISLAAVSMLEPTVRDAEGTELSISWQPVGPVDRSLGARTNAIFTWRAAEKVEKLEKLAVGTYQVTVALPKTFPPPACGMDGVHVEPAALRIVDTPPDSKRNAAFTRRLDLLAGRHEQLIRQLRGAITDNPGNNLPVRMELVDALDAAGQSDSARKELLDIGYEIQHADKGKRRAIPPWLALRLEDLKAKSKSARSSQ